MPQLNDLFQQGTAHAWLFIPSAILLGALHGLEPGHSKTMMAAFIVAIRGTVGQAVMLGVAAALSHTAIVWVVALIGLRYAGQFNAETTEPYFQIASAVLIIAIALWMLWRSLGDIRAAKAHDGHHHLDETQRIDTGHGVVVLSIFEDGVPPRFRAHFEERGRPVSSPPEKSVSVSTVRPDGATQAFSFAARDGYLESVDAIPEPHAFKAKLDIGHGNHVHSYDLIYAEHDHGYSKENASAGYHDAHEKAHAQDIAKQFGGRDVTNGQIVMFGLTGGLIPCPAAITVLLLCLQLKQVSLGIVLVACFSVGLAITMVAAGALAALSVKHALSRWSGFGTFARYAPLVSSALIIVMGLYLGWLGWSHLGGAAHA